MKLYRDLPLEWVERVGCTALQVYAETRGWVRVHGVPAPLAQYRRPGQEHGELLVPLTVEHADHAQRLVDAVMALSAFEKRNAVEVLADARAMASDVIQVCIPLDRARGDVALGLDNLAAAVDLVRQLLLASACVAVNEQNRGDCCMPARAVDYIRGLKAGVAGSHGCVVSVLSPLPLPSPGATGDPLERQVVSTLVGLLERTKQVAERSIALGNPQPFKEVDHGLDATVCGAVAGILSKLGGANVEFSVRWSPLRRMADAERWSVTIPSTLQPALLAAARILRASQPADATSLVGVVTDVSPTGCEGCGELTVMASVDGSLKKVAVRLCREETEAGVLACWKGQVLHCTGVLQQVGRDLVMVHPRDLSLDAG